MRGKLAFHVVMALVQTSIAESMFYHEPSREEFKPDDASARAITDFGFSMGYQEQEKHLFVGAPHADRMGRIYRCNINQDLNQKKCELLNIDVEFHASDFDKNDKDQKYCLGATIATTSKYILTCAPLWSTSEVKANQDNNTLFSGSYGTCFVYSNNKSVHRLQGTLEQIKASEYLPVDPQKEAQLVYGGLGWSSLADESKEVLLIGKPFNTGEIQYINSTDLEKDKNRKTKSLFLEDEQLNNKNRKDQNRGYAFAAGKFLNASEYKTTTIYAVSMKNGEHKMTLFFLSYDKNKNTMKKLITSAKSSIGEKIGDMYGTAMSSADMNQDGIMDLIVGAPSESPPGSSETGAIYIHRGGHLGQMHKVMKKVESWKVRSRFGTAVVATDLDGDSIPEIIVSAPYEDDTGTQSGALYVLSGHEIMVENTEAILKLEDLKYTQRIHNKGLSSFGFCLHVIRDINGNGCDELAVGAPQRGTVTIFRCVPTVTAKMNMKLLEKEVKSNDLNFTVQVCVTLDYHTESRKISTQLQLINKVQGYGAQLQKSVFTISLATRNNEPCENVVVDLVNREIGEYNISSKLEYLEDTIDKTEFNPNWIRLSIKSDKTTGLLIKRTCAEVSCTPNLDMKILWGGSEHTQKLNVDDKTTVNVTLLIKNSGAVGYRSCVSIKVTGAKEEISCQAFGNHMSNEDYVTCLFQNPIEKNASHSLNFSVGINQVTDMNKVVHIETILYNVCRSPPPIPKELEVELTFSTNKIRILDDSHNLIVTNTQIKANSTLVDKQEFKIENNGSLTWENVAAIIYIEKKPYIFKFTAYAVGQDEAKCVEINETYVECVGMKLNDQPIVIKVNTEILYNRILENLVDDTLKIDSHIEMRMAKSNDSSTYLKKSQTITIKYMKETTLANNMTAILVIAILTAIILLICVACILYKVGFFERKEKNRLESLSASVRSKSRSEGIRPSVSGASNLQPDSKEVSMEDFDMEVLDDSPFENVPYTDDKAALIAENKDDNKPPATEKRSNGSTSSHLQNRTSKRSLSTSTKKDYTTNIDRQTVGADDVPPEQMEDFDIEVVDDSPFENVASSTDDKAALIAENKDDNKTPSKAKRSHGSTSSQLENRKNKRSMSTSTKKDSTTDTDRQTVGADDDKSDVPSEGVISHRFSTRM